MATLKTQQKEKLVKMLSKYYTLDNEASISNFIGNIANDYTDRVDARLELMLIAYSLMGKEKTPKAGNNTNMFRIHFNPYPSKLCVVKELHNIEELNLAIKKAKEIADSQQITVDTSLLDKVQTAIRNGGGNIEWIEKL